MATAPLLRVDEADTASVLGRSVARGVLPFALDTSLPMTVEADTAFGGTTVAVAPLPTAVEVDACDVDVAGTISYLTVPGTGLGLGPLGVSPLGEGTASTVVPITVSHVPLAVGRLATAVERDLALPLTLLVDNGEFAAAIEAIDRVPIYSLKADWNRNGLYDHPLSDLTDLVSKVHVIRDLTGSLPVEVGIVEGYSTAALQVTLEGRWRKPPDSYIDRINLALNPSVETGTAGYTVVSAGTLSAGVQRGSSVAPPAGSFYLYVWPTATDGTGTAFIRCPLVRVTPGSTYTLSAYRNIALGTLSSTYVGVDWMDGDGNQLFGTTVNGPNITGSGWARGSVTATAPDGAVYARQFLVAGTTDADNYARWDAVLVEKGGQLGDYFDGDTSGASWDGVAHASTSRILAESDADYEDSASDLVDVFAPYRSDSPLYGKPVLRTPIYFETGFIAEDGPRFDRRFTGTVTKVHPVSGARVVELEALDTTSQLRQTITVPGTGLYEDIMAARGPDAYRTRINSHWLIDRVLRANGVYAGPPARDDALLSVTGAGSMLPEIGWGGAPQNYFPTYRGEMWFQGPFGNICTVGADTGLWWPTDSFTAAAGDGFGFSLWIQGGTPDGFTNELLGFNLSSDGGWRFRFGLNGNGVPFVGAIPAGGAETRATFTGVTFTSDVWHYFGVHVQFAATAMTVRFHTSGTTYISTVNIAGRSNNWRPDPFIDYTWVNVSFNYLQLWRDYNPPTAWIGETWVPQADLDPGVNELTGIPELLEVDSWNLIKEVCAAEGSTFWFTEDGRAQFRTSRGDQWYSRQTRVSEEITADRNLADLASTTDESTVRNIITVRTKQQLIGDWVDGFKAATVDQFDTPPGTTVFELALDASVYEMPSTRSSVGFKANAGTRANLNAAAFIFSLNEPLFTAGNEDPALIPYIRVCLVYADNPVEILDPVADGLRVLIRVDRVTPWSLRLHIINNSPRTVRFATPTQTDSDGALQVGQPALIVPVRKLTEQPEQVETYTDDASRAIYGPSIYEVGGDNAAWKQTPEGLRGVASEVLASTSHPVPVLDAVDVPHDPRRRLGQRVVLADPQGLGKVAGSIVSLTTEYSNAGAMDQVAVRPIAPPGLGVLDDPTHGLLDASLVVGP